MNFTCPRDQSPLSDHASFLHCALCDTEYSKTANLYSFLTEPNTFYEGAYLNRVKFTGTGIKFFDRFVFWLINSGYLGKVQHTFPQGSRLLELGCAGGVNIFGKNFNMTGCDLSFSSLKQAADIYDNCLYANPLIGLPLPDNSLDGVISSFFWEHLDGLEKKRCLQELHRVLKPGGKIVFLYDVETDNPLIRYFKKQNLSLYQEHFLDQDGHIGYESVSDNMAHFEEGGFSIVKNLALQKTFVLEPSMYHKFTFWNSHSFVFRILAKLGGSYFFKPFLLLIRICDTLFAFLPDSWARITLTIAEVKK